MEASKETQINKELSDLSGRVDGLEAGITELLERLKPITRQEVKPETPNMKESIILVPLAERIRSVGFRISNCSARISEETLSLEI